MSNHPRCHTCQHQRGPRSTAPMAAADNGRTSKTGKAIPAHGEQPKKAGCGCLCHERGA